jgi:hypothetical protein
LRERVKSVFRAPVFIKGCDLLASQVTQDGLDAIVLANPPQSNNSGPKKFEFKKQVKFTMSRKKVKMLLQELEICNNRLDTFAEKAEKLDDPYKANKKSKFALPLRIIQDNAARLYDVLSRSWCSSHPSHCAGLLLEQRLVRRKRIPQHRTKPSEGNPEVNCFGLSLLQSPSPLKWLNAEFRLIASTMPRANRRFGLIPI